MFAVPSVGMSRKAPWNSWLVGRVKDWGAVTHDYDLTETLSTRPREQSHRHDLRAFVALPLSGGNRL